MKILLLGEYSNLHVALAEGLRRLGHQVTVISNGNKWRGYKRDIDLCREGTGKWAAVKYVAKLLTLLPRLRGYDVVQLINPDFLELKAEREFAIFRYLRRNNRSIFVGAYGCDWYWVHSGITMKLFRYGDFYIGDKMRDDIFTRRYINEFIGTAKGELSQYIDSNCDGIPTCLYEYQKCYEQFFPHKTRFIPLPIQIPEGDFSTELKEPGKVRFFIGMDSERDVYKGTDVMNEALKIVEQKYPDRCVVVRTQRVPYDEYIKLTESCDCILDQLYSYTPAINALVAMAKGIVCIGGGEPENYEIINETELRPIINVLPSKEDVAKELEKIILHPEQLKELKRQSIEYVRRHHDNVKVAQQYVDFWTEFMKK